MKKWLAIAALCFFSLLAIDSFGFPRVQHVVIISIDGGKPSVITNSAMPNLQQMVSHGAVTWSAKTIFPCLTLPSHTSMLTGLPPSKHKILWNTWLPAAGWVACPTVFSLAKKSSLSTAMFAGKEKFQHLAPEGTVDWFSYDRGLERVVIKPALNQPEPEKSATVLATNVAMAAAQCILKHRPSLCFVHLTDPDDAGHEFGWGSSEQKHALADVDIAIGFVTDALRESGILPDTTVIVSADHGGHGNIHGLNIPEDMTIPWIAWGAGVRRGCKITNPVSTMDTAATALWLLGVPLPQTMEGKPVEAAFEQ